MPPYGMPESVEVYGGGAPSRMAQPYSVAPGSDWGTAVPAQQAMPAQGGWNIGPNGPRWIGVPSDNMGAASGAVFRTRNIANPMTLYREMGYNPNYNMPGSMDAYQRWGVPPVVTQRSPYASLAAVYGPGNSVAPLTGFPSQYPHVLNGVPQDYLAPTLSLYEIPMYQQSGLANMLMAAMMGGMRNRGAGAGGGGGRTKKPGPEYQGGQAGLPTEPLLDLPGPKPIIGDGIIDTYRRRSEAIAGVPDLTGASVGDMALPPEGPMIVGPNVGNPDVEAYQHSAEPLPIYMGTPGAYNQMLWNRRRDYIPPSQKTASAPPLYTPPQQVAPARPSSTPTIAR